MLLMLKGGHKKFRGSFYTVASCSHSEGRGGGTQKVFTLSKGTHKVLPCLEWVGAKGFGPMI